MSRGNPDVTLGYVSMYVDILSSALDQWVTDLSGPDLIEYALLCREELRAVSPPRGGSAYTALAAEIAYDRSLIALCTERGIYAHATSFAYPRSERERIETVLRQGGVDLDAPPKRRGGTGSQRRRGLVRRDTTGGQHHPEAETAPPRLTKGASGPAACLDVSDLSQDGDANDDR